MRMGLEFGKRGMAKYISHLDLQRAFSRAIRRSKMPVKLSQGFNPHFVVSFASALALGIQSECECVEMALEQDVAPDVFLAAMKRALPPGLEAKRALRLAQKAPKLMAAVREAEYAVYFQNADMGKINAAVCDILDETQIVLSKVHKGKTKEFDMRPMILQLDASGSVMTMRLASAPTGSLKPQFVLDEIGRRAGSFEASVVRVALYAHVGGKATELLTACSDIDQ